MLSTALLMASAPATKGDGQKKKMSPAEAKGFLLAFVLFLIIDLALLIYTLYCLFECKFAWYINVLVILLLLSPGLGFIVALSVIVYHYTTCGKAQKPSFEFEFF